MEEEKKGRSLWRRIRIYAVGLLIGTFLSFFFFKGRGCSAWTPSHRVTEMLTQNMLIANDTVLCKMKANQIKMSDIERIVSSGDVDFSISQTKTYPKIYVLEGESVAGNIFTAKFSTGERNDREDTISHLIDVSGTTVNCEKNSNRLVYMSSKTKKKLMNIDHKIRFYNDASAQIQALNIHPDSIKNGLINGELNSDLSDPELKPKASFVFNCVVQNQAVRISFTKNGEDIEIQDFRENK